MTKILIFDENLTKLAVAQFGICGTICDKICTLWRM